MGGFTLPPGWSTEPPRGLLMPGNIDLMNRPIVPNGGGYSTVLSGSYNIDGREVLLPHVSPDGRILNAQQAIDLFRQTGQHLGMFKTAKDADIFAQQLHEQQAQQYDQKAGGFTLPPGWTTTAPNSGTNGPDSGTSWLDSILSALGQGGIGAAKGAGSTAFGLGSIVNSASKYLQSPLYPHGGVGDMIMPGSFDQKPQELVPQGTAQKVGYGAEQVGEFLVPGGMASKAAKGLPFAERAALQGLAAGGTGAAQSGGSPSETLKAAAGGVAGEGIATALGGLLRPFAGSVDQAAVDAAGRQGVTLPASAQSTSKVVPILESIAAKGIGGGKIAQRLQGAQDALVGAADAAVADASKLGTTTEVGRSVADGMAKFKSEFLKTKGALYDAAALPEAGVKVDASGTRGVLDQIISSKGDAKAVLGEASGLPFFKTLRQRLSKPVEASVLLNARKELNRRAGSFADPLATGNKGILKSVIASLDQELDGAIAKMRPDIAQKLSQADAYYADGISKINSSFGKSITKLAQTGQYDKISQAVVNSRMSVEDITGLMKVAGPEGADGMRSVVLSDLFAKSKSATGEGFMPLALARNIGKFGPDRLQALLGADQWDKLKDIALLTSTLQRGQKIAEGSQTAYLTKVGAIGSALYTNPLLAFKLLVGDTAFTKFIGSSYGQRWLTSGLSLGSGAAGALRIAPQGLSQSGSQGSHQ